MLPSSWRPVVVAILLVVLGGACATPDRPPPVTPAIPAPPPPPPPPTGPPPVAATVEEACLQERPFSPDGPRYSGPGPHRMRVDFADVPPVYPSVSSTDPAARIRGSLDVVIASFGDWPDEWAIPYEDDDPRFKETVQLLVCVFPAPEALYVSDDGPTVNCEFIGGDVPFRIVGGEYRVRVLEARTGAPVGRFTVPADQAPGPDVCPRSVTLPPGVRLGVVLLGMNPTAFQERLRPYVTNPR